MKKVLLVEDDPRITSALGPLLEHHGFDIRIAHTIGEAKELLGGDFDWVILDLMLPDGEGEDLLSVLIEQPQTRVVVTTGVNDRLRLERMADMGPTVILPKPLRLPDLLQVLNAESATSN